MANAIGIIIVGVFVDIDTAAMSATMTATPASLVIVEDCAGCVTVPNAGDDVYSFGGNAVTAIVSVIIDVVVVIIVLVVVVCVTGSRLGAGEMKSFGHAGCWTNRC